jgi:RNA polymerase sigma factor (sigma-70 family)
VFLIARHVWHNSWRSRTAKKRSGIEVPVDAPTEGSEEEEAALAEQIASTAPDPLAETLARERQEALAEAFAELPSRMRACVELQLGHGFKQGEIAAALQITVETVKTQLKLARERLRPRLARFFGGDFEEPFS